jgi:hypothetical protein
MNSAQDMQGKRRLLRLIIIAMIVAAGINLSVYTVDLLRYLSHMDVYTELRLGQPRQDAMVVLERYGLDCGRNYPRSSPPLSCTFSDFWRVYNVGFSPEGDHIIVSKRYDFKHEQASLGRLIRWLIR